MSDNPPKDEWEDYIDIKKSKIYFNEEEKDLNDITDADTTETYDTYDPKNYPTPHNKFSVYAIRTIRIIYILAIICWFFIIYWSNFFNTSTGGNIILLIPVIVFGITFSNLEGHTIETSKGMLKGNILSFMFLTVSLLLNWFKIGDKKKVFNSMLLAVFFIMISLLDYWVQDKDEIFVIHIKSIAQTFAIILLLYSLYLRYSDNYKELVEKKRSKNTINEDSGANATIFGNEKSET